MVDEHTRTTDEVRAEYVADDDYAETEFSILKRVETSEWGSGYPQWVPRSFTVYECARCGGLVLDRKQHEIWHDSGLHAGAGGARHTVH